MSTRDTRPLGEWSGHQRGTAAYRRLLAGLFFAGVATFAQLYSPQGVLPLIADQLQISAAQSALTVSAATIGLAVAVIPWSVVADHLGRVRAMTIAVVGATLLALAVPFAPSFPLLLSGRLLEGLMLGGVPALAIAYLNEEVDPRHATRAAGTYVAGTTLGGLSGRLLAGPIGDLAGWRIGVLAVAVLCAIAAALFIKLTPPSQGFVPHRHRERSADMATPSLAHRLAGNLRSPRQIALYLQGFLLMGGFVALYNYFGFHLSAEPFGLPQSLVSLIFIAYLAGTWSSAQAGVIAARFGRLPVILVCLLIMAGGVVLTLGASLIMVLIGLLVATAGFFGVHSLASGWTGAEAPGGRAQAASLYNLFYYAGSSLFGWFGGVVFIAYGWSGMAAMVVILAALAAVIAAALLRRPPST